MSYIQIEIGGEVRGLTFDEGSNHEYNIKVGDSKNPVFVAKALIWSGIVADCYYEGRKVDFTFKDVCQWADKLTIEDTKKIQECYLSNYDHLKDTADDKEVKSKKKSQPKNLKRNASK